MQRRSATAVRPPYYIRKVAGGYQVLDSQQRSHGTYTEAKANEHLAELLGTPPAPAATEPADETATAEPAG